MRTPLAVGFTLAVLFSFTACDEGTIEPPPPPYEIIEIIEYIEDSFTRTDIGFLKYWLHSEFAFYFDPTDVGDEVGGYIIPESWVRDEFIGAADNIFDMAHSIDITVDTSVIDDPLTDDNAYTAADVPVDLLVMTDQVNGYLAQGTFTFELRTEYNEKNGKAWRVTAWRDFTSPAESGGRSITPASFGELLARFYKP